MSTKEKRSSLCTEEGKSVNVSFPAEGSRSTNERPSTKGSTSTNESLRKHNLKMIQKMKKDNNILHSGTSNHFKNVSQSLENLTSRPTKKAKHSYSSCKIFPPTDVRYAHLSDKECLAISWKAPKDQKSAFRVYVRLLNFFNKLIYEGFDTSCTFTFSTIKQIYDKKKPLHFEIVSCNNEGLESKPTVLTFHPRFPANTSLSSEDHLKSESADQSTMPSEGHRKLQSEAHPKLQSEAHPKLPSADQPRLQIIDQPKLPNTNQPKLPTTDQPRLPSTDQPRLLSTDEPKLPSTDQPKLPSIDQPKFPSESHPSLPSEAHSKWHCESLMKGILQYCCFDYSCDYY